MEDLFFISSPIKITLKDVNKFCKITGDIQQFHLSEEQAHKSFFKCLVAPGAFITSLVIKTMWEMHSKIIFFSNFEVINLRSKVKYINPTRIGDHITYEWKLLNKENKIFKKNPFLFISWEIKVKNQNKELIARHNWDFGYVKQKK